MIKCCPLWACSFFYISHAVMLMQLFKDEGLKVERLGFFFHIPFLSLPWNFLIGGVT